MVAGSQCNGPDGPRHQRQEGAQVVDVVESVASTTCPKDTAIILLAGSLSAGVWAVEARLAPITVDPQVCQGQACIRGLRIPVSLILKHLAAGRTPEEIVDDFPELEVEDVREALRYASWLASGRTIEVPSAA